MNEVVNITKIASANPRNVGFANAVLNSLARKRDSGENLMPDVSNYLGLSCHSHRNKNILVLHLKHVRNITFKCCFDLEK